MLILELITSISLYFKRNRLIKKLKNKENETGPNFEFIQLPENEIIEEFKEDNARHSFS